MELFSDRQINWIPFTLTKEALLMAEREEDAFERKESKKDKGYIAFRSDDDSVGEEEEEDSR